MKKILIITLEYPPQIGGIASYVANFVEHYTKYDVVVYAPKVSAGEELYDMAHGWKVYRQKQYFKFFWPRWVKMIFKTYQIIKREQITELHIHHVLPVGYIGWIFKKFLKIPYTIFFHGSDIISAEQPSKLRQLRTVVEFADGIVVNSQYLQQAVQALVPKTRTPFVLHPCPSDTFIENPPARDEVGELRQRLALSSKKVILSVGRLVEGKGHRHFLEILPRLLASVPNLTWVIIGAGPVQESLFNRARELHVESAVRFIGSVPSERLRLFYSLADIFVMLTHPTKQSKEGWGVVFLEAAAANLPVVAGRGGGVEEAVIDQKTGIIVDVNNPREVLKTILDLLARPEYAQELGRAGRERVLQEFTWAKQLQQLP
jgi:phosphatidylinositol alpha-1,6-mannosyltransferase